MEERTDRYYIDGSSTRNDQLRHRLTLGTVALVVAGAVFFIPYASASLWSQIEHGVAVTKEIREVHKESRRLMSPAEEERLRNIYVGHRNAEEFETELDYYAHEFGHGHFGIAPELKTYLRSSLSDDSLDRVRSWLRNEALPARTLENYGRRELGSNY